jgi:single-strand DNA-binding protein
MLDFFLGVCILTFESDCKEHKKIMNSVNITGRYVADPEVSDVGGKKKVRTRIAHQVSKDKANFFEVVYWEKAGELAEQYVKKGGAAAVTGRISQETWEKDGEKKEKVLIVADRFDFAVSDKNDGASSEKAPAGGSSKPAPKNKPKVEEDDADLF